MSKEMSGDHIGQLFPKKTRILLGISQISQENWSNKGANMLFICNETLKISEDSYTPPVEEILSWKTKRTQKIISTTQKQNKNNKLLTKEWLQKSNKSDFKTGMHLSKDGKVKSQASTLLCWATFGGASPSLLSSLYFFRNSFWLSSLLLLILLITLFPLIICVSVQLKCSTYSSRQNLTCTI